MEYEFKLVGKTPLLIHADDVEAGDELKEWRTNSANKPISIPGDDRSPAWTWQTYLYSDGQHLALPSHNLMISLRYAAAKITLKGNTSFKQLSQSGIFITSEYCDLFNNGEKIAMRDIVALRELPFAEQSKAVRDMGFSLFVKRAAVGQAKHVRVRAKLDAWSATGRLIVSEQAITPKILGDMVADAGRIAGLMDWRPSSKSSGSYGMFDGSVRRVD